VNFFTSHLTTATTAQLQNTTKNIFVIETRQETKQSISRTTRISGHAILTINTTPFQKQLATYTNNAILLNNQTSQSTLAQATTDLTSTVSHYAHNFASLAVYSSTPRKTSHKKTVENFASPITTKCYRSFDHYLLVISILQV